MWCFHQWKEYERLKAQPPASITVERGDANTMERLAFGVTSIVLACEKCGDRKVIEIKGIA